ncbi:helix-turn-helix domain-containing protein [Micromonospora sp. NBC_00389]
MVEVTGRLRVSRTAVYGWQQRWRRGGEQALASRGPGGSRPPAGRLPAVSSG